MITREFPLNIAPPPPVAAITTVATAGLGHHYWVVMLMVMVVVIHAFSHGHGMACIAVPTVSHPRKSHYLFPRIPWHAMLQYCTVLYCTVCHAVPSLPFPPPSIPFSPFFLPHAPMLQPCAHTEGGVSLRGSVCPIRQPCVRSPCSSSKLSVCNICMVECSALPQCCHHSATTASRTLTL